MSTFSGLNTATTALWANRRGMDVTGQNIANVNTEGYSRQRVGFQSVGGSAVPAFFSTSSGIGQGVSADEVLRIRDAFLEGRGHTEHANRTQLVAETDAYELVEQAFREPGENGLQKMLSEVWSAWQDVANKPDDLAARGQVLKRLETVVGGLHFSQAQLDGQWGQTRENLAVLVDDVNAAAENIATLNVAIRRATQSGLPSNDLADKRDLLVMQLADQVGATVRHGEDGVVDVIVGGMGIVNGGTATRLGLAGTSDPATIDPGAGTGDLLRIVAEPGNVPLRPAGTAAGQLNALNTMIPTYRKELDAVAVELATKLNAAHEAGFDLDGDDGQPLLGSSAGPVTASSIKVLLTDPRHIAASSVDSVSGNRGSGNADAIAQIGTQVDGVDARYRAMVVELGVQSAVSQRNLDIQASVTTTVDAARDSVAGVNLDEELTNMLSYQHAYAAAGRMITAIDETLDVLINRTGLVGR